MEEKHITAKKIKKNRLVKWLSRNRFYIQLVLGVGLYILMSYYKISLWWLLGAGVLTGIIWGKVFCRWACPLGIIMELLMKAGKNDASLQFMYQYHKIGCPIAWISGWLNKFSFFKINVNQSTCSNCGLCDKACYISVINTQEFSLYQAEKNNPAENFSCSKCLKCIENCPNGSLTFKTIIHK